ncbi:phage minor head protein [uncultured Porphyromonas sp.]|jgi:SPP1 gp7 family putative phage head morphogenesis protein|uniref:phage head morphogenesis protein n=1 Tax=uncultured Porphyromonas sp. TaxID=159274 RepID=UPI002058B4AA|nr:phage minor head protein [uncultured Porphyromonas sp.]DAZ27400.1 MAG TPA: minor capsid component [Caudoviricetes sp.]
MTPEMLRERPIRRLISETAGVYLQALDDSSIQYEIPAEMRQSLEQDIFVFSGFKTYHQLKEASELLRDNQGRVKSFNQFYQDVSVIRDKYNRNWLHAEYNFAVSSAQMASHWAEYQQDEEMANLQYRTALDDKVRPEHAALEGVTLPMSDPFWDTAFPPNGWHCRCHVIPVLKEDFPLSNSQRAQDAFDDMTQGKASIFRYNPGKEGVIFPPHHPYYGKRGYKHCLNPHLATSLGDNEECDVVRELDGVDKDKPDKEGYTTIEQGGATIKVHKDADPIEVDDNIRTGLDLVRFDPTLNVRVREHIREKGVKNPEFEINEVIADAKRVLSEEGITSGFKTAIKQEAKIVIIDFDKNCADRAISYRKVAQKIDWRSKDFDDGTIERAYVIHRKQVIEIRKEDCNKETIMSMLKEKGL